MSGVGKRLAARIVLELKEKVAAAGMAAAATPGHRPAIGATEGEVVAALQALGYSLAEARAAARMPQSRTRRRPRRSRTASRRRCGALSRRVGRRAADVNIRSNWSLPVAATC